jgi:single-strand DNA-binding protein
MINKAQVMGRVGRIDTRMLNSGTAVTNLSMVTSKAYKKDGEKMEKVTWHNITMYSKLSEIAEKYVAQGDLLYIEGEIDNQTYMGKDGVEKTKTFILAHELKLIPKGKSEYKPKEEARPIGNQYVEDEFDTEIPF